MLPCTSGKWLLGSDFWPERSPAARELAETALVWLLFELRDLDLPAIVLGGLVPQLLTQDQNPAAPQHLGTTDVDLLIALHIEAKFDFGPMETALENLQFEPDLKVEGWRWWGLVSGARVKFEFLTDLDDQPSNVVVKLPGCGRLTAANLRGTGFVAEDYQEVDLVGELPSHEEIVVRAKFAGLEGYLLSKAHAARERGEAKDYYDLVYVLLFNRLGGPVQAATALREGRFGPRLGSMQSVWRELAARFAHSGHIGPRGYAEQALLADPSGTLALYREDAVGAIQEFLRELQGEVR